MPESISDPYGKAFMAYYKREKVSCTIRRDDGYVDEDTLEEYFREYDDWSEVEKKALAWARGRVLDVGCGPGRHSLWLQGKGFMVTAIDVSPTAVEVATVRGVRDCRVMDVRSLDFSPDSFDTVIMMGNNFGLAGGVRETQDVLRRLHGITSDQGLIIATTRNPLITENPSHLAYHGRNRGRGLPPGLVTIRLEFRGKVGPWFNLLLVTPEEMAQIAEPSGWYVETVYVNETDDSANYSAILLKK